jgi:hypothetical protein
MSADNHSSSSGFTAQTSVKKPLTNWQRSVEKAFREGSIGCNNELHVMKGKGVVASNGKTYPVPAIRPHAQILELMEPYKKARCQCERDACKWSWKQDHPGQLQQEFVCFGSFTKGVGKYDPLMPGKRVMPTPFRLSREEHEELVKRFPDWIFVQTSSAGHDHPVSHCTTMIATYELTRSLPSGSAAHPMRYLDLHGNPRSNARVSGATKQIRTVVNLESPRDYIRQATKWGPEKTGSNTNYYVGALRDLPRDHSALLAETDQMISIHTLYYYDRCEIASALAATKGRVLHAIMHRHRGTDGELNLGELRWAKEPRGDTFDVKQTNKRTGESYVHPDSDPWFASNGFWTPHSSMESAMMAGDRLDSLAWTSNMVCEGTYRLTITVVPARVATIDHVAAFDAQSTAAPVNTKRSINATGVVQFNLRGVHTKIDLRAEHVEFFDMLRKRMMNKPRDSANFKSHTTFATIKANSVMSTDKLAIEAHELRDLIIASFWVDFETDLASTTTGGFFAEALAVQHNALLAGKHLLQGGKMVDTVMDAIIICLEGKSIKSVAIRGLQLAKSVR